MTLGDAPQHRRSPRLRDDQHHGSASMTRGEHPAVVRLPDECTKISTLGKRLNEIYTGRGNGSINPNNV